MIHIAKTDTGFIVATIADNGEVLSSSEVLSSKQKCWTNVFSQHKQWDGGFVLIQDDCRKKSIVYCVDVFDGKVGKFVDAGGVNPEPKYIPSSTKPKYQPKKK